MVMPVSSSSPSAIASQTSRASAPGIAPADRELVAAATNALASHLGIRTENIADQHQVTVQELHHPLADLAFAPRLKQVQGELGQKSSFAAVALQMQMKQELASHLDTVVVGALKSAGMPAHEWDITKPALSPLLTLLNDFLFEPANFRTHGTLASVGARREQSVDVMGTKPVDAAALRVTVEGLIKKNPEVVAGIITAVREHKAEVKAEAAAKEVKRAAEAEATIKQKAVWAQIEAARNGGGQVAAQRVVGTPQPSNVVARQPVVSDSDVRAKSNTAFRALEKSLAEIMGPIAEGFAFSPVYNGSPSFPFVVDRVGSKAAAAASSQVDALQSAVARMATEGFAKGQLYAALGEAGVNPAHLDAKATTNLVKALKDFASYSGNFSARGTVAEIGSPRGDMEYVVGNVPIGPRTLASAIKNVVSGAYVSSYITDAVRAALTEELRLSNPQNALSIR